MQPEATVARELEAPDVAPPRPGERRFAPAHRATVEVVGLIDSLVAERVLVFGWSI